ncbi:MAG: DUF3108 domain-containing protein [Deltaproteobacteria bacterium]|nr:DUF3108 domain-containing protein [Deltaproteobacteria bacterium]
MLFRMLSFFTLLLGLFGSVSQAGGLPVEDRIESRQYQPDFYPFERGESAAYWASWNGIPVASAEIHVSPVFMDGKKFYQAQIQARTWKYLELLWKMRDSIESVFEAETLRPRRFIFYQRENRKRIDTIALFDPGSKKWVVHRQQGAKIRDYEFVSQNTLDPISAVYLARSLDFKPGDKLRMDIFGGKSRYWITLDIVGQERISVKAGVFDAYKIMIRVSNLTRSGYAGRVRQATGWISADAMRKPLKMVSEIFVGSVNIEMVEEKVRDEKNSAR